MATTGPGAAHSSPKGCFLWGSIGVVFLLVVIGAFTYWVYTHSTQDPAEARAWAAEMIDLEFPAEAPASSAVQLHDVTLVFGSSDLEDPMKPSFTLVGSLGEERFEYDQLASYEHDPDDSEAELLKREHTLFQARGDSVKCLHLVYDDGTEDYSLILDGKTTSEGDTWQCMLIFKGPPATNTRAWVQGVLDTVR